MHPSDSEEALLGMLRALFGRTDPVPTEVTEAAHAAFGLRDLDAQLARLLRDSAVEEREVAGVRGATATRLLTFAVDDERFVEVDVWVADDGRTLSGYLVPGAAGALTVEHAASTLESELDDQGRFSVSGVPPGPVRLRLTIPGVRPIVTEWLPL